MVCGGFIRIWCSPGGPDSGWMCAKAVKCITNLNSGGRLVKGFRAHGLGFLWETLVVMCFLRCRGTLLENAAQIAVD